MTKEKKTAEELAAMILQDLSNMDGCPKRGVTVTVYGLGAGEAYESDIKSRCTSMLQIPYCRSLPWPRECS
jgi:hypothetical protein